METNLLGRRVTWKRNDCFRTSGKIVAVAITPTGIWEFLVCREHVRADKTPYYSFDVVQALDNCEIE